MAVKKKAPAKKKPAAAKKKPAAAKKKPAAAKKKPAAAKKKPAAAKKKPTAAFVASPGDMSATEEIDARIKGMTDWRGKTLGRLRALIKQADPDIVEEVKWRKPSNGMVGVPVWSHGGLICTGETYKDKVKLTFARGAALPDPTRMFNSSLEGNARRAIDFFEGVAIDEKAFLTLFRAAVALSAGPGGR